MREDEQSEPLEICWRPSRAIVEQSNLARFIARNGLRSFEELLGWSVADVGRFWDAVVRDLGLEWYEPYTKVLDLSRGTPWATWWIGARFNYVHNALDRHAAGANRDKVALIWEGEDGKTARLTYGQLAAETGRCANALRALGLKKGDRVGLLLPMIPEVVVAQLAIGKLGAVFTPIFSGFGPEAVAARLQDCDARVLITCDGIERRGKLVPIKEVADRAVALSPSVEKVLVVNRLRRRRALGPGARPLVARAPRGPAGRRRYRAHRAGGPAHDHLHVGDDRPAQGRGPCAGRVSDQGRAGYGPLLRRQAVGHGLLVHRYGVDDGAVGHQRETDAQRERLPLRRHARLPGPGAGLGDGGAASPDGRRDRADRDPRAHARGRRLGHAPRPLEPPGPRLVGRAVEPRRLALVPGGGRRRPLPRRQLLGRDRGERRHRGEHRDHAAEAGELRRAGPGHGRRRGRRERHSGARQRR